MDDQGELPASRRIWRWILVGSVALNLVFIGLFSGAALRHLGDDAPLKRERTGVRGYAAPYVQALPEQVRRAFANELRTQRRATGGRQARAEIYQQMVGLVRTQPFQVDAVREVLNTQAAASLGAQSAAQDLWLAQITQMSDAERMAYADRLDEVLARREQRGREGGRKPPRD